MGTFVIDLQVFSISGSYTQTNFIGIPVYQVGDFILPNTDTTIVFTPFGNCVSLNGSPTKIPLAGLPAGFNTSGFITPANRDSVLSPQTAFYSQGNFAPITDYTKSIASYNPGSYHETQVFSNGGAGFNGAYGSITGTLIDVIDLFLSLNIEVITSGAFASYIARNLKISGTYNIISTQWILKNLTRPSLGTTFVAGDKGIFTTDPVGAYDFTTITSVKLKNRVVTVFDTQTSTEVTFTVTEDDDDDNPVVAGGTQFSGWAVINPITVYAANKSGIYKVVANKTHDTIYLSSGSVNTTENVAIPDPIAITGFIGG